MEPAPVLWLVPSSGPGLAACPGLWHLLCFAGLGAEGHFLLRFSGLDPISRTIQVGAVLTIGRGFRD